MNTGKKAKVKCVPVWEQDIQRDDLRVFYGGELRRIDNAPFYAQRGTRGRQPVQRPSRPAGILRSIGPVVRPELAAVGS